MDTELENAVKTMADKIVEGSSKYFFHPDPVARIYGMTMAIEAEIINRMKAINQSERHSYDG